MTVLILSSVIIYPDMIGNRILANDPAEAK
jgi:hypothetical protein